MTTKKKSSAKDRSADSPKKSSAKKTVDVAPEKRSSKAKKDDKAEHEEVQKIVERSRSGKSGKHITSSSTAEYFSKNLQQVGFSSPTKAVLTTLKEAFDN